MKPEETKVIIEETKWIRNHLEEIINRLEKIESRLKGEEPANVSRPVQYHSPIKLPPDRKHSF
jgi:hypothetical protein